MSDYYNVDEVALACLNFEDVYPTLATCFELPESTWEGRAVRGLHISTDTPAGKPALLFVAGLHGSEWGGTEILINLAADLLESRQNGSDLAYGKKSFGAGKVSALLDAADVVIVPLANPDGRHFSQAATPGTADRYWRKNRRPGASIGVDLNRNLDFLFNVRWFAPTSPLSVSTVPSDPVYQGPAPESEPETVNLVALLDRFPTATCLVDLHGGGRFMFHNWGDDDPQTDTPTMNFDNRAFDSVRGIAGDRAYGEYIAPGDLADMTRLMKRFVSDAGDVRGTLYGATSAFQYQPCAGSYIDYAYARHRRGKPKVYGFGLEWGAPEVSWLQLQDIIRDVCAGLVGFGLETTGAG